MRKVKKPVMSLVVRIVAAAAITACAAGALLAQEATLTADSMNYNPNSRVITVEGNVHITGQAGEIFGDAGRGSTVGDNFEMWGNVKGRFTHKDGSVVNITCATASLKGRDKNSVVTASGDVRITRGTERLAADAVRWSTSVESYSATGNVLGSFTAYSIDADAVSRNLNAFEATNIRKFHENSRKITMSASRADGTIKNNEVTEMTAEGGVVATTPNKDGGMTRIAGDKAVYSLARGTLVVTGRANITQTGRALHSESLVYFLDSGRIDAVGAPSLTFETDRKK
ncbi:MAG: hypothetical protein LBT23_12520 [Synergistaceae bacterium]|jgi:lipopolysaccharide export system protein LptA|nr:hypothetical protein [Synergistaceae bacterium]